MLLFISLYTEICSSEEFIAKCRPGHVILITSGQYGRMKIGRCVRVDFGFVGCYSDVIRILDRHCSGRAECQLKVPDPEMDETEPCLADLTHYLDAEYLCVPGTSLLVHPKRVNLAQIPQSCMLTVDWYSRPYSTASLQHQKGEIERPVTVVFAAHSRRQTSMVSHHSRGIRPLSKYSNDTRSSPAFVSLANSDRFVCLSSATLCIVAKRCKLGLWRI